VKYPFFIIIYLYDVTMQSSQLIDVIKIIFKPFFYGYTRAKWNTNWRRVNSPWYSQLFMSFYLLY